MEAAALQDADNQYYVAKYGLEAFKVALVLVHGATPTDLEAYLHAIRVTSEILS